MSPCTIRIHVFCPLQQFFICTVCQFKCLDKFVVNLSSQENLKISLIKRALEPINIYACLTPCCECACQFSKIEVSAHELFVSRYVRTALSHVPSSYRGRWFTESLPTGPCLSLCQSAPDDTPGHVTCITICQ